MRRDEYGFIKGRNYSVDLSDFDEDELANYLGESYQAIEDEKAANKNTTKTADVKYENYQKNFTYGIPLEFALDYKELISLDNEELCVMYQNGNKDALTALVIKNKGFVNKYANTKREDASHYFMDVHDIAQECTIGLIVAASKFRPDLGFKFTTYCKKWMKYNVSNAFSANREIKIPKEIREKIEMIKNYEVLYPEMSRHKLIYTISEKENLSPEKVEEYMAYREIYDDVFKLNSKIADGEETEFLDILPTPDEISIDELVDKKIIEETIANAFQVLPKKKKMSYCYIILGSQKMQN